jgi:hypothetical protein
MSRAEWRVALGEGWGHFKEELGHYWMGTKLLGVEVKIATRLLFKTLRGEPLTRWGCTSSIQLVDLTHSAWKRRLVSHSLKPCLVSFNP